MIARVHMCKTAVEVKFMADSNFQEDWTGSLANQTWTQIQIQLQTSQVRITNTNTKPGEYANMRKKIPEFQGQQAQQLVEVNGVVLVVGKVGTLVQAPLHLAIHWLPPQSRRSQPGIGTVVNSFQPLKILDQTEKRLTPSRITNATTTALFQLPTNAN